MIASLSTIRSLPTADLLKLYNALTKKSTTKFASRENGEAQTFGAAKVAGLAEVNKLIADLSITVPEPPKVAPAQPLQRPAAPSKPEPAPSVAPKPENAPAAPPAKPGKAPRAPKPDAAPKAPKVKPVPAEKPKPATFRPIDGGCPLEGCGGDPGDQTPAGREGTPAGDERNFCHKCKNEYWVASGKLFARKKPGKDIGASISRSWMDKDVRAARSARHGVLVTGDSINPSEFKSVCEAFRQLRLPLNKHIKFRASVKKAGKGEFIDGKRKFLFAVIK